MLARQTTCRACSASSCALKYLGSRRISSSASASARPQEDYFRHDWAPPPPPPLHRVSRPQSDDFPPHSTAEDAPPHDDHELSDSILADWSQSSSSSSQPRPPAIVSLGPVSLYSSKTKPRTKLTRDVRLDLPPLPWPNSPGVRHNMKQRALSRLRMAELARTKQDTPQANDKRWFPQLDRQRVTGEPPQWNEDQPFYPEVQRYTEQYVARRHC
jgi:hypothetical protein